MLSLSRVALGAIGVLCISNATHAALIYPGVNSASSTGLSSAIRKPARVFQTFIDSSLLSDITSAGKINGLSFRITPNQSSPFPSTAVNFAQYDITLAKPSASAVAANGLTSDTFADNMVNPVLVRSGPLTIDAKSFTDSNTGVGPAGSSNFAPLITFSTSYDINPGEDLVVLIRHNGYTEDLLPDTLWNFETFAYPNGERVATSGVNATAHDQGTSFRNDAMKFAFDVTLPEPSSALALTGLVGLLAARRRTRQL